MALRFKSEADKGKQEAIFFTTIEPFMTKIFTDHRPG
jgi:hypothetical protein